MSDERLSAAASAATVFRPSSLQRASRDAILSTPYSTLPYSTHPGQNKWEKICAHRCPVCDGGAEGGPNGLDLGFVVF